jgi:NAD(P)-dependent dehydrogenase (short-subunit alcohol dehydrogenase family)
MRTPVAIVTGASRGLGLALTTVLARGGWRVVVDARDGETLHRAIAGLPGVVPLPGNVTEAPHREAIVATAVSLGGLDLLVNNAGALGPSPLPSVARTPLDALADLCVVNVLAPLALIQHALPHLRKAHGIIVDITSDAAVAGYEGWGGYGATKAALAQLDRVLAVEEPDLTVWSLDPGDLRTEMHQLAFPGEDISDRSLPDEVAPALLRMLAERPPSGRHQLRDWLVGSAMVG